MKTFVVTRKSGYPVAHFSVCKVIIKNVCGCGKVIKVGKNKVEVVVGESYPTPLCTKCVDKLIDVLNQVKEVA